MAFEKNDPSNKLDRIRRDGLTRSDDRAQEAGLDREGLAITDGEENIKKTVSHRGKFRQAEGNLQFPRQVSSSKSERFDVRFVIAPEHFSNLLILQLFFRFNHCYHYK